ncbi:MAG: hypothetical protein ACXIVE_16400 [Salinarimonas sp.]
MSLTSIATDIAVGGATGAIQTIEPISTELTFETPTPDLMVPTVDPLNTNLIATTETINLGALRDMGLLPPPQVMVDQALHLGIDATTGLALDPVHADLATQYKIAALGNSPKFIEQGFRSDLMNAMAAGAFFGYVQTLEANSPELLDPYRISAGSLYITGQLANNRLVVSYVNDGGYHFLRANSESAEVLLAYIRSNNMRPQSVHAIIERGIERGLFSHVPHAAVENVAQVILNNTPGFNQPELAPAPAPVVTNDLPNLPVERFSGTFTGNNNVYTLVTEEGTQFTLTNLTETLLDHALGEEVFEFGAIEIRSPFFSGDGVGLEAGAVLRIAQLPSQSFEVLTDDGPIITGGGGLREFAANLFASYTQDLGDNVSLRILGDVGIGGQRAMDSDWAARYIYDQTELALRLAVQAEMGDVSIGGGIGQQGDTTVASLYGQLVNGEVGLRLEANTMEDGSLAPTVRFVLPTDGRELTHDEMRTGGTPNALVIQVSRDVEGGVDIRGRVEFGF